MRFVESRSDFGIGDHFIVDDEVGNQATNELAAIMHWILALLFNDVASGPQFNDQCILIKLLVQTGFEFVQYGHGGTDDVFSYFFVEHKKN